MLLPVLRTGKAVKNCARCVVHNKLCPVKRTRVAWAGTPCVAWSSMGAQRGEEDTVSILACMAWAGLHLLVEDDFIVHENVGSNDGETLALT
eukprot:8471607-Alexandrium_andersonii.AAC.1